MMNVRASRHNSSSEAKLGKDPLMAEKGRLVVAGSS